MPAIGELRHRVVLQEEVVSPDGAGGQVRNWRDITSLWAAIEAVQGGEHLEAMRLEARVSHRITVRHRPDIRPGMRMLRAGTPFNLRSVVDLDGRQRFLSILAEEGGAT
jgi:SPP1 family predicted phage head-tail adaptor